MAADTHRIGRLRFDLTARDDAVLERFSEALERGGAERISAALEKVLGDAVMRGETLHLDRLELDLGDLADDGTGLDEAVAQAVAKALYRTGADPAKAIDPVGTLCGFLSTGQLPLVAAADGLEPLMTRIDLEGASLSAWQKDQIRQALQSPAARRRAVAQLPGAFLERLASGDAVGAAVQRPAEDASFLASDAARLQALLEHWVLGGSGEAADGALGTDLRSRTRAFPALSARPPGDDHAGRADRAPNPAETAHDPVYLRVPNSGAALPTTMNAPAAGLVLLGPFIAPYCDAVGLSQSGQFRDAEAQQRAVLLVHALATDLDGAPEPDLALAKLLCGLALDHPVPRQVTRSLPEKDEAESLLSAVIRHWGALGSTTPDGLRDGFLRRPGVLQINDEGRFLIVERWGGDVLLDRLPWTLSLQQTPFMEAPLLVDWR